MSKKMNVKMLVGIFAFCLASRANGMTLGIIAYIMQSYSDVPKTVVQYLMVVPSLVGTIYAFFVGTINQKVSTKNLTLFGQVLLLTEGLIMYFLGGKIPFIFIIIAVGCAGFCQGSVYSMLGALLLEAVEDENKRKGILGICMTFMNICSIFYNTMGGKLAVNHWTHAYSLFFIIIACLVVEVFTLPNTTPAAKVKKAGTKGGVKNLPIKVWAISIHYLFFFMFMYVYGTNISEYIIETHALGTSVQSGIAASCVSIGGMVAGALFGLYSKWLKKFTVPFAMGLTTIGLALPYLVTTNVFALYVAGTCAGFAMSAANPYIISQLAKIVKKSEYTNAMSIYTGFMNTGMFIAIYVIAFLTKLFCGEVTVDNKFLVGAVGATICFVLSFPIYLSKDKPVEEDAA